MYVAIVVQQVCNFDEEDRATRRQAAGGNTGPRYI